MTSSLAGKVDKVTGKGLSTEDYTTAEKQKLATVAAGTTKGDMQYWAGSMWVRIPAGQPGQVLSVSSDSIPQWTRCGMVTDIDGNTYRTVVIGNQEWTIENLKVTRLNDGTEMPLVTENAEWSALTTPGYCWYENKIPNRNKWGALYNWYAVNTGKLAPAGWRVPGDADWTVLENYLIANGYNYDNTISGNKIAKSLAATTDWTTNATTGAIGNEMTGNNLSGFSALPSSFRYSSGGFSGQSFYGTWWSATGNGTSTAWCRALVYYSASLSRGSSTRSYGYSVRFVRDVN